MSRKQKLLVRFWKNILVGLKQVWKSSSDDEIAHKMHSANFTCARTQLNPPTSITNQEIPDETPAGQIFTH